MREIKFRAWHKPFQKTDFGSKFVYGNKAFDFWSMSPEDYELEQFTGLHDKNGKEIYEGDIVQLKLRNGNLCGTVIYEKYYFTLKEFYNAGYDYPNMAFSEGDYEVIGNIHEKI